MGSSDEKTRLEPDGAPPDPSIHETVVDSSPATPLPTQDGLMVLIGRVLDDRYRIDELVGKGGMGAVFRAEQVRLRRQVAIKIPKPEYCHNPEFLSRFEREALSMAKIVHENIVQIYDVHVSRDPAQPSFIAMEFVKGPDLEKHLRSEENQLTIAHVCQILRGVARGIDAAHDHGIVHRDIKPSNVVVTLPKYVPKIMDFGVARIEMEDVFKTQESATIGTPAFMAPEQVLGKRITGAADIYAFGMMTYRIFTRKIAYDSTSATSLLYAQVQDPPIPAHLRNPNLPESFQRALQPALEKEPESRPARAIDIADAVAEALKPMADKPYGLLFGGSFETVADMPTPMIQETFRRARRRSAMLVGGLGVLLLVVLALTIGIGYTLTRDRKSVAATTADIDTTGTPPGLSPPDDAASKTPDDIQVARLAPPTPAHSPAPSATPPPARTPEPTRIPAVEATPRPTEKPAQTAAPTATPGETDGFDRDRWDIAIHPPITAPAARNRIRKEIDDLLSDQIERPLRRSEFSAVYDQLRGYDEDFARDLVAGYRDLTVGLLDPVPSFVIGNDSVFWEDRAVVHLQFRIEHRLRNNNDPTYRPTAFQSQRPITAWFVKEETGWMMLALEGDLADLVATSKERTP